MAVLSVKSGFLFDRISAATHQITVDVQLAAVVNAGQGKINGCIDPILRHINAEAIPGPTIQGVKTLTLHDCPIDISCLMDGSCLFE